MRDSKTVWRLRGKVAVIRNLGCNYTIARRKKQAGGMSLQSPVANEFSAFLTEESHVCKIKSQCLFDEGICMLCRPSLTHGALGKESGAAGPGVRGVAAERAAAPPTSGQGHTGLPSGRTPWRSVPGWAEGCCVPCTARTAFTVSLW